MPKYDFMIKSATITKEKDSKYYCSICYEYKKEIKQQNLIKGIGLDYSSPYFYIDSEGNKAPKHIKTYKCSEKKLKKLNRQLAKKKLHSKNFERVRLKIAKTYRHIKNARQDYLHKLSYNLSNKYDYICVENLNIKGLINQKETLDNSFGTFMTYLDYKLKDRGKILVKIDKFYPSSQLCNVCGYQNKEVKDLKIREWKCPHCHIKHDRDINASKNILQEGQKILRKQNLLVA